MTPEAEKKKRKKYPLHRNSSYSVVKKKKWGTRNATTVGYLRTKDENKVHSVRVRVVGNLQRRLGRGGE